MDTSRERVLSYYEQLKMLLTKRTSHQAIVDAPFCDPLMATNMNLGMVELLLVGPDGKTITMAALSETEHAKNAAKTSEIPLKNIQIPVSHNRNSIARAIRTGKQLRTEDWDYLFTPVLGVESARFNQATAGIACSVVQPFSSRQHTGAIVCSFYKVPDEKLVKDFLAFYVPLVKQSLKT